MSLPPYPRTSQHHYSFSPFTPISSPAPSARNTAEATIQTASSQAAITPSPESPELATPHLNVRSSTITMGWQPPTSRAVVNNDANGGVSSIWQRSMSTPRLSSLLNGLGERSESGRTGRAALGDINLNTTASAPPLALASPFVPADPNTLWGPPPTVGTTNALSRQLSIEERLAEAEDKIRRLTLENKQLKDRENIAPTMHSAPHNSASHYHSPIPTPLSLNFADSVSLPGYGGFTYPSRSALDDLEVSSFGSRSAFGDDMLSGDNTPSPALVASVLHGTFDYNQMHAAYIRPIVWVVAHRQSRNNAESAGLKAAVNALATRFMLSRDSEPVVVLIDAILEWAKPLCFTSCGNYLCQQLLEKGDVDDKKKFIDEIREDLVAIASDKFGTHVLCKAVAVKELEDVIAGALVEHGIFESFKTGARRLWREYLEKCRQNRNFDIIVKINAEMKGKWAELACANEHGSIAVQQVFEVFGSAELMEPCFRELLSEISRVANNQFGHFVITKLISYPPLYRPTCDAILGAYPPVATSHHGVNFAKIALTEGGRASIVKYIEGICSGEDGRTPGIVAIATSSIGKAHLTFVLSCLTPAEHVRVRQVCRAFSTTLRNSQSGNDLLRSLGLIHAIGTRHRTGTA